jgi:hypothetical protein
MQFGIGPYIVKGGLSIRKNISKKITREAGDCMHPYISHELVKLAME